MFYNINKKNKTLKKIFIECEIPLDKNKRKYNLNHSFRHSFGVYMAKMGVDVITLAQLMRHASIESSQTYTKITTTEQIKLKTDFANYIHNLIPTLYNKESIEHHPYCSRCGAEGSKDNPLTVDYIVCPRCDKELFYDKDNLQVLCRHCHNLKTRKEIEERKHNQ